MSDPETAPTQAEAAKPTVTSKEEFDRLMAEAKGPVVVDFIQDGCGHCDEETPAFKKLVEDCKGSPATIMRVEVTDGFGAELADKLDVQGTPTALYAKSAEDFLKGATQEVSDLESAAVRRKLKCAR